MAPLTRAFAIALLMIAGCDRPTLNIGGTCTLNSDCSEPLVCGLERCRRQCVDSRDCAAGLLCLRIEEHGGVCQLPEEAMCSRNSDCPEGLGCRFGTCTTECVEDRDCQPGATCTLDMTEGSYACVEQLAEECIYNSDCPEGLICAADRSCRLECVTDVDCNDTLRYCAANNRCYPYGYDAGAL